jgi:hypothetical protein
MATPGERKALLFFGMVAMLGAGVRVWQARRPAASHFSSSSADTYIGDSVRPPRSGSAKSPGMTRATVRNTTSRSRTGQINRDSTSIVDLDRATTSEIDALGVLPKGTARLIVADRDSFGPFGSMDELRRVPFLSASTLRKLAPRVTFSRIPRPRNTVVHPRSLPASSSARRKPEAKP